jgi:GT2 family glycosyltransferase
MEICLVEDPNGIRPGWFALSLGDCHSDPPALVQLLLLSDPDGRVWMDYSVPVGTKASHNTLLVARSVFFRAVLRFPGDYQPMARPPSLTRMPTSSLLLMAARRAPFQSIAVAWWRLIGKKVRARHRLQRILAPMPCFDFTGWLDARTLAWQQELLPIQSRLRTTDHSPRFRILIGSDHQCGASEVTLQSIHRQLYDNWEIAQVRPNEADAPFRTAGCDWLLHLADGDSLTPDALLRIADATADSSCALIYWDDVVLDASGRIPRPRLKPDWNLDLFLSTDYVGAAALRCSALPLLPERAGTTWHDLLLRIADGGGSITHIPRILSHHAHAGSNTTAASEIHRHSVATYVSLKASAARVALDANGHVRVAWPLPDPAPLVSVIVPTRDRLDLLRPCIDGVLHRTDYPAVEILIADNDSRKRDTHAYFRTLADDRRVRILSCPGPFNHSSINNQAAREATGSILAFLNNDTEVVAPNWLRDMAGHALRKDVGAVGAKLLYPNGLIQHAGIVVGLGGLAGHPHRFYPHGHPGYLQRLVCTQRFSAVTAACLVIERAKFLDAGGFDEAAFPVAYNDVDLCLRLRERGLESVWTPYAVLRHKESASRRRDTSRSRRDAYARESEIFRTRWRHVIAHDPCYNPHLTRADESFLPAALEQRELATRRDQCVALP